MKKNICKRKKINYVDKQKLLYKISEFSFKLIYKIIFKLIIILIYKMLIYIIIFILICNYINIQNE